MTLASFMMTVACLVCFYMSDDLFRKLPSAHARKFAIVSISAQVPVAVMRSTSALRRTRLCVSSASSQIPVKSQNHSQINHSPFEIGRRQICLDVYMMRNCNSSLTWAGFQIVKVRNHIVCIVFVYFRIRTTSSKCECVGIDHRITIEADSISSRDANRLRPPK